MKKKSWLLLGISILACTQVFAQDDSKKDAKGLYLGTDNDTKEYLVGAPADNWYLTVGAGAQTYIGNEMVSSARYTAVTPAAYFEVGKWVLPDVAISLNFAGWNMQGQTRYSRNPFVDFTKIAAGADGFYPYQKFCAYTFSLNGLVTIDWTNLFAGYEKGYRKKLHILTPVGLGCAWLTGQLVNPKYEVQPNNFELDFVAAIIPEITLTENLRLVPAFRFQLQRASLDYSSYEQNTCRFDYQPSVTLGLKFNLSGTKKDAKHKTKAKGEVGTYHVFIPVENSKTYEVVREEYADIASDNADLQNELNVAGDALKASEAKLADANAVIAAQAADLEAIKAGAPKRELNPMEEILLGSEMEGLPSVKVFFPIRSSVIDTNGERKLSQFVKYINDSPSDKKFFIAGAADAATGTPEINYDLSVARAKAVYNYLVKRCGVYPGKLEIRPLGGINEYSELELNRVGIVVETSDALTKMFDKYSKKY